MRALSSMAALALAAVFQAAAAGVADDIYQSVPADVRRINPAEVVSAAAEVTTNRYPDADSAIVDSVQFVSYRPDGCEASLDDTYTKVLTEKGRREESESSFHYNAFYSEMRIILAEVVKPDGMRIQVDLARNSEEMIDDSSMSANIYDPNDKVARLSFPDVEIGDMVHAVVARVDKVARVPGMWSAGELLECPSPVVRYTFAVRSPVELPIKTEFLRDPAGDSVSSCKKELDDGRILHIWEVRDVPCMFPEPDMPSLFSTAQRLLLSTSDNWADLSKWYWNLCRPHLECVTDDMRATVSKLKGASQDDTTRAVFTWVSQNVRYMGVTTENVSPGYEPHDISMTYSNRYGVCRDKAALLVGMLRVAGVDAYPVLIHVGDKRDQDVPMTAFNHAIVGVRRQDGSYELMDPTNENAHELLPAYLDNRSFLVAHPDGELLRVSPIRPASLNMLHVDCDGEVDGDGRLSMTVEISYDGINDNVYRGGLAKMPDSRRKDFFEGLAEKVMPGAKLLAFEITPEDLRDTDEPLETWMNISVEDFLAVGENAVSLRIPRIGNEIGYVNFLTDGLGLEKRKYPLMTETACGVSEHLEVSGDFAAAPMAIPSTIDHATNGVSFHQKASVAKNKLVFDRSFALEQVEYSPAEYAGLRESLRLARSADKENAIFKPVDPSLPDTRTPSSVAQYDIYDGGCVTSVVSSTCSILTYAGLKSSSELTFNYNPKFGEVEVLDAKVVGKDGVEYEVKDYEQNLMDASWVASAPRYPAGKTLVVSLPGVDVGSLVSTKVRLVKREQPFAALNFPMRPFDPCDDSKLVVSHPVGMKARHAVLGEGISESVETNGDRVVWTWTHSAPARIMREDSLPPRFTFMPTVLFSTGDWAGYAERTMEAIKAAAANSGKAAELAKSLTSALSSEEDKVKAVRDYVDKNIRGAGPADFTSLPFMVSDADVTLSDGYGHGLDQVALMYAMLSAIGIDSTPILVDDGAPVCVDAANSGTPRQDPSLEYASPSRFATAALAVHLESKGYTAFLNTNDQYSDLGASYYDGHVAIPMGRMPGGSQEGDMFMIGVDAAFKNKIASSMSVDLRPDGSAEIRSEDEMYGMCAAVMRKEYKEMTPELLARHYQKLVSGYSLGARGVEPLSTSLDGNPVKRGYSVHVPDFAVVSGGIMSLELMRPDQILALRGADRKLPLMTNSNIDESDMVEVVLPAEVEEIVMLPKDLSIHERGIGDIERKVDVAVRDDGRKVVTVRTTRLNRSREVRGPEYAAYIQELNRRLTSPKSYTIVLRLRQSAEESESQP